MLIISTGYLTWGSIDLIIAILNCDREPKILLNNLIFAAIPHTEPWGLNTFLVMIICNTAAIAIVAAIPQQNSRTTPNSPTGLGKFDLPTLIAAMSFGHILGVGFSLGLTNLGII
ncbi:photosystem I reaction center subunit PsaK [Chamaesiphon sp. GL140_3_metabinner_50]|uniref:photosystem I reaction center subunit PsaK n=1 Tax=Chamaesiphon sp. GL140_3_metabinner_50 TaxID=2970812 RepID=UPI002600D6F8|nr:photosystem I reaction center subunit PsaK [Chamaesiphon sp. GL140_3_metabinner_50]